VVFPYPVDRRQTFVKRVVGMPGDRIKIVQKRVFRNDAELEEPYATHKTEYMDPYRDNFPSPPNVQVAASAVAMLKNNLSNGEIVVPDGNYFVLGDNRDNSLDSRYWGFVPRGDVLGKPFLVYYSEDVLTDDDAKKDTFRFTWDRVRWNRFFKAL
jgi:signal peptidase I